MVRLDNEIASLWRQRLRHLVLQVGRCDLLDKSDHVIALEARHAHHHLVYEAAERPPIDRVAVTAGRTEGGGTMGAMGVPRWRR